MPIRLRLFLISFLLLAPLSAEPMPWAQLKVGMAAEEILSLLGDPVMRSKGRGFETWTYDDGAEVLIYGLVVGWTMPASATVRVRSEDVWRNHPRGDYYATLRSAVRKAGAKPAATAPAGPLPGKRPDDSGMGYERFLQG